MRQHLGPEIAGAKKIRASPLYVRGEVSGPPKEDLTRRNLFIRGRWRELISHFRYALICKGLMFSFLTVTDERIKNVFVGNESARVKPKEERESTKSYNSLSDLVVDPDLVIVHLGFLGHKNVAMAGSLKESLMLREVAQKATWIVDHQDFPFAPGHFAYSEDVSEYIFSHFETLDLGGGSSPPQETTQESEPSVEQRALPSVEEEEPQTEEGGNDLMRELNEKDNQRSRYKFKHGKRRFGGGGFGGGI